MHVEIEVMVDQVCVFARRDGRVKQGVEGADRLEDANGVAHDNANATELLEALQKFFLWRVGFL